MDNALKYTPDGGEILITAERLELYTKIVIQNTGIGISSEDFNDIFKRFFRESKVQGKEGIGIGLYIAREIVMQQGGFIKVTSKEGDGAVFSIYMQNSGLE